MDEIPSSVKQTRYKRTSELTIEEVGHIMSKNHESRVFSSFSELLN